MIGNNKLILNQATMQEAIQYWLDSKSLKPLSKVNYISSNNNSNQDFTVAVVAESIK